jgi:hypothetical protein|tara:strand:- start:2084 stop:2605 length:522 start_codon:yes stop_codon:yes gene_type:complete
MFTVENYKTSDVYHAISARSSMDPYINSPFLEFKRLSSKPKGKYFEEIYDEYALLLGEQNSPPGSSERDRKNTRLGKVEVKGSFGWITNGRITNFRWQQIRPHQDYDHVVFIAVYPDVMKFYVADKETVVREVCYQDENGNWPNNQHGGKRVNSGTFCIDGYPKDFPWMKRYA